MTRWSASPASNKIKLTDNNELIDDLAPKFCGGDKIVFSRAGDIWVMNTNGSSPVNLTPNTAGSIEANPDCRGNTGLRLIVFESAMDQPNGELYTVPISGSPITRLTNNSVTDQHASWCGTRIIFSRDTNNPETSHTDDDLFIIDEYGGNELRLNADDDGDYEPACSPDGLSVAWARLLDYQDNTDIWRMKIPSSTCPPPTTGCGSFCCPLTVRLTTNFFETDSWPTWSPGGSVISFSSNRALAGSTDYEIYKMDADDGELEPGFIVPLTNNSNGPPSTSNLHDVSPDWGETKP